MVSTVEVEASAVDAKEDAPTGMERTDIATLKGIVRHTLDCAYYAQDENVRREFLIYALAVQQEVVTRGFQK